MAQNPATTSATAEVRPATADGAAAGNGSAQPAPLLRPDVDVFETDDRIVLLADMPGVSQEDIEVTLERRVLTVRGHAHVPAPSGYRQVHGEYRSGDYERVFVLSEDIARDDISASIRDGVLRLELPKAAPARTRRIEVRAA